MTCFRTPQSRILLTSALLLGLSGCFQVQLSGPIAAAEVSLSTLKAPREVIFTATSSDRDQVIEEYGEEAWEAASTIRKLLATGVVRLPESDLARDQYYLLSATGGYNRDPGAQLIYRDPAEPVNGTWHAILPPHRIGNDNNKLSLLTEASYQWYLRKSSETSISEEELSALLNSLAQHLVDDVDQNGIVDYDDLIAWSIYSHKHLYRGEPALLDQLDLVLSLNASNEVVSKFALRVVDSAPVPN